MSFNLKGCTGSIFGVFVQAGEWWTDMNLIPTEDNQSEVKMFMVPVDSEELQLNDLNGNTG